MRGDIFVILLMVMGLVSCQPDTTCRQDINVCAGVVLQCTHTDTLGAVSAVTKWDSITIQGVGSDSVLYNNAKGVDHVYLPLRTDTTVTAFTLTWQGKKETLYIQHDNTQRFISMACGCAVYHTIEKVWCKNVWADTVTIINAAVETYKQDNIRIYATTHDEKK